jgi:NHL repeat
MSVLASVGVLVFHASVAAAEAPIKEVVSSHIGWKADALTGGNVCTAASGDQCQFSAQSGEAGGFSSAEGVAVNNASALVSGEHGDIYVADTGNRRIDAISPAGAFVLAFGKEVDKTTKGDLCTAESKDVCQAGVAGAGAGQFSSPTSLTVDPATGNVYVEDYADHRIQESTATGEFILMIGKEVDKTKVEAVKAKGGTPTPEEVEEENLCTAASKDECKSGEPVTEDSPEPGAFYFARGSGQLISIGGPEDLLYVGDGHRVQMFKTDGTPAGEIPLTSISSAPTSAVMSLAVDGAGDVFVVFEVGFASNTIYEFDSSHKETKVLELSPVRTEGNAIEVNISTIAVDAAGRLAIAERENGYSGDQQFVIWRGGLYELGASLHLLSEFTNAFLTGSSVTLGAKSLAFNDVGNMYAVRENNEMISYSAERVAALSASPAVCKQGADNETDATFECELRGEVNPWGVHETEVWFGWGRTARLGSETPHQPVAPVETSTHVSSVLDGLTPNATYYFRLVGQDEHVKLPEFLSSETMSVTTQAVPPRLLGEPMVLHTGPFSAVMFGELNPEHALTEYRFQYWPCENSESCPETEPAETTPAQSTTYGAVGTTVEVSGLRPSTLYHYRLRAKSQGGEASSEPGVFTTDHGPAVAAQTGSISSIGATSALVSGTVNPGGQSASYRFELGRYAGPQTQFGTVFSGSAGSGSTPVDESLYLTGLQPGTTYSYRIAIQSGDGSGQGEAATGASMNFTTAALPPVLHPMLVAMLPVPAIRFPTEPVKCKHGYRRDKHGKCSKVKKKRKTRKSKH